MRDIAPGVIGGLRSIAVWAGGEGLETGLVELMAQRTAQRVDLGRDILVFVIFVALRPRLLAGRR
jgi:hypothetical protein